jgi:hypothetical protein
MFDELMKWGVRLFTLLPELMGLWEAAREQDAKKKLDASLALIRRIEDMQAKEELGG